MTAIFEDLMLKLYGHNIWNDFIPTDVGSVVQGWNGNHPLLTIVPDSFSQQIIVDIGVWKGQSTINIASSLRDKNINGVVIAVDTFLGSAEHWSYDDRDELVEKIDGSGRLDRVHGMPSLYKVFLSNIFAHKLTDYVIPLPQTSTNACNVLKKFGIAPTLVHVDAAHDYREALADISDYWDIMAENGILIGDDYTEGFPGILKAAGEFSARVSRPLSVFPPKFALVK